MVLPSYGSTERSGDLNDNQENDIKGNSIRTKDRLSEMPDDILSFILSFLSMRDAVKARILSSRWRYLCASMLNLNFDLLTVLGINDKGKYSNGDSDILWEDRRKFVRGVDQFLELYRGQKIDSLRVHFCLGNESACYIDRLINFAVRMEAEKLHLNFSSIHQSNDLYNFPCQLLPQGNTSPLKHLCLKSCELSPSPDFIDRLISLKTLDLNDVHLDQSGVKSILFGCLNLEWLRLKKCSLPLTLCIHGPFLRLKTLVVHDCCRVEKIELSSIGLTTFEYIGRVKSFSFADVPRLEKVHIRFIHGCERSTSYMFHGLANDLPQLQILSLVLTTHEVLPIPANITRFNSLRHLELFVVLSFDFNLLSLTSILNASPVLQKFHLALATGRSRGLIQKREYSRHVHFQLKEVKINGFFGRSNEMELALYLLDNAVSLERMILSPEKRLYRGGGRWSSFPCPWYEWERKQAYDVLLKEEVKRQVEIIFL
uniref:F-box domain-containing protein n=1 Tax=Davidia involucrata TaxID=16924 RepID=A0A5B7C2J8_DAVIN